MYLYLVLEHGEEEEMNTISISLLQLRRHAKKQNFCVRYLEAVSLLYGYVMAIMTAEPVTTLTRKTAVSQLFISPI